MTATTQPDQQTLQDEIAELERRLQAAKSKLNPSTLIAASPQQPNDAALHALLLLSDSALPLGSFAFSSGLESYLAHHKPSPPSASQLPSFYTFLKLSLSSLASTALAYVHEAYRHPEELERLDNDFDASTPCTVARRASIAQGRALLGIWERSFGAQYKHGSGDVGTEKHRAAVEALSGLQTLLKRFASKPAATGYQPNAHLPPLWGLVCSLLGLSRYDTAYLFLFSHARTVISAAVRASVMGPYQAQAVLASRELQDRIKGLVDENWDVSVEDAGQSVPVVDLWVGRHEKLYSRIFNS